MAAEASFLPATLQSWPARPARVQADAPERALSRVASPAPCERFRWRCVGRQENDGRTVDCSRLNSGRNPVPPSSPGVPECWLKAPRRVPGRLPIAVPSAAGSTLRWQTSPLRRFQSVSSASQLFQIRKGRIDRSGADVGRVFHDAVEPAIYEEHGAFAWRAIAAVGFARAEANTADEA